MVKCSFPGCDREETLPFRCKYCNEKYCLEHRLPEKHNCKGLDKLKSPLRKTKIAKVLREKDEAIEEKKKIPEQSVFRNRKENLSKDAKESSNGPSPYYTTSLDGQVYRLQPTEEQTKEELYMKAIPDSFSVGPEALDVLLGLLIVISSFTFSTFIIIDIPWSFSGFIIAIIALTFFTTIYPRKLVAKRFGYHSRYILTKLGVILTLITLISPVKFLNPGILVFAESYLMRKKESGLVNVVSPILNIIYGSVFILLAWLLPPGNVSLLFAIGTFLVSQIVLIRLLPLPASSGKVIMKWNWLVYAVLCLFAVAQFVGAIFLGALF